MGDQLFVSAAEGSEAEILDISDPVSPQPIPGGRFTITDDSGRSLEAYHASLTGNWGFFARKEDGGGVADRGRREDAGLRDRRDRARFSPATGSPANHARSKDREAARRRS